MCHPSKQKKSYGFPFSLAEAEGRVCSDSTRPRSCAKPEEHFAAPAEIFPELLVMRCCLMY